MSDKLVDARQPASREALSQRMEALLEEQRFLGERQMAVHASLASLAVELRYADRAATISHQRGQDDAATLLLQRLMSFAPLGGSVRVGTRLLMRQLNVTDRQVRRLLEQLIERRQLHRAYYDGQRVLTPYPEGDAPPSEDSPRRASRRT